MKHAFQILCMCLLPVFAIGCAHTRSNTRNQKEGNQILVFQEFKSGDARVDFSIQTDLLGMAVDLGIKAAKKLIEMEAEKYEAEYSEKASHDWKGVSQLGGDPLAAPVLDESKVIVFSRSVTNKADGLEWSWEDESKRNNLVGSMVTSAGAWITESTEQVALRTNLISSLPTKGYPTFVALFVVSPFKENAKAMRVSLVGYFYPALKAKRTSIHVPFTKWDKVESAVTLQFTGPDGERNYSGGKYESSAAFKLGDVSQKDEWISFGKKGRISLPLAVPTHDVVTTQVRVVESSKMKKILGEAAEAVGKLKAKDLGIKE